MRKRLAKSLNLPMEVRPHVGAAPAAHLAREPGLDVRQPDIIRPRVARDRSPMAAMMIRPIDQEAANTGGAHFGGGDFLRALDMGGHAYDCAERGRREAARAWVFQWSYTLAPSRLAKASHPAMSRIRAMAL
jgi:hypothetical protein